MSAPLRSVVAPSGGRHDGFASGPVRGKAIVMLATVRGRTDRMWWGTAVESPDPAAAVFYENLLGWPVVHQEPGTAVLKPPQDGVFVVFQRAEDYIPPTWPPASGRQRTMMHLDVQVDDLVAAVADAESLGAVLADVQPQANVRVMFDPDGRPFCLCQETD